MGSGPTAEASGPVGTSQYCERSSKKLRTRGQSRV